MVALPLATEPTPQTEPPDTTGQPDLRRITEDDPQLARLKSATVRKLTLSVRQFVRELRSGVQPGEAQSAFIHRHTALMKAAYVAAHKEGQRDYYDAVSRVPGKWAKQEPDDGTLARRMAFYAPSVAKMAYEAVQAFNTPDLALSNAQGQPQPFALADVAVKHTGVMVAFMLSPTVARKIAQPGGEPASDLHITLAFLGDSSELDEAQRQQLVQAVYGYAARAKPLRGSLSGIGRFNPSASSEGKVPIIALVNAPGIQQWRAGLAAALEQAGTPADTTFEYTPHITLAYVDADKPLPAISLPDVTLRLDKVTVAIGDEHHTCAIGKPMQQPYTLADTGGGNALDDWLASTAPRIVLQADLTWSGGQDGYTQAGWTDGANPFNKLWWDLEPVAQHCPGCPMLAAASPYDPPWTSGTGGNVLMQTPGDGQTECGAGCKCSLRYGSSAGDVYPDVLDMKTWAPPGIPSDVEGVPEGPMRPAPVPPPRVGSGRGETSPAIPGGNFSPGQKRALDLYRLAELNWNAVRGSLPELPNFFTLTNPNFEPPRLPHWDTLTRAQQQALEMAFEAYAVWMANVPREWLEFLDDFGFREPGAETVVLYSPNQARFPKGSGRGGQFAPEGGGGRAGHAARSISRGVRGAAGAIREKIGEKVEAHRSRADTHAHVSGARGKKAIAKVAAMRHAARTKEDVEHVKAQRALNQHEAKVRDATKAHYAARREHEEAKRELPFVRYRASREIAEQHIARAETRAPKSFARLQAAKKELGEAEARMGKTGKALDRAYERLGHWTVNHSNLSHAEMEAHPQYKRLESLANRRYQAHQPNARAYRDARIRVEKLEQQLGAKKVTDAQIDAHPSVVAARGRIAKAQATEEKAGRVYLRLTNRTDRLENQANAAAIKADISHGGIGVRYQYSEGGRAAMREVFGKREPDTRTLATLVGAKHGDVIQIEGVRPSEAFHEGMSRAFRIGRESEEGGGASMTFGRTSKLGSLLYRLPPHAMIAHVDSVHSDAKTTSSGKELINGLHVMRALGVARIYATAAGEHRGNMNGYYTWAHLGGRGKLPEAVKFLARQRFGSHVSRVEQVMSKRGGGAWWKVHGSTFQVRMDLYRGGRTRKVLDAYEKALAKRAKRAAHTVDRGN